MAKTKLLAIRCPEELLNLIEQIANTAGKSKTEIVIEKLRELSDPVEIEASDSESKSEVAEIWSKIEEMDQRLKKLSA